MADGRSALVVGAGIGGLTAAIALRNAGWDVRVFERAERIQQVQVGTGLHIWPNAMNAFKQLELDRAVYDAGVEVRAVEFRRSGGSLLAAIDTGKAAERLGAPSVGIRRTHLHRVLLEGLGEDRVTLGATCTGFRHEGDRVVLELAAGREERGALLIGADGLRSTVRAQLLGDEPPRYHGYTSWLGLVRPAEPPVEQHVLTVVWGRGGRFIFYYLEPGLMGWIANLDAPEGEQVPEGQRREKVLEFFGGWAEPVPSLVRQSNEGEVFRMDLFDRDPVDRWGEGRVTLLGDAAHAMTPNIAQGACMGIEDAVELPKHLAAAGDDVAAGLRAYEASRQRRTTPVLKRARLFGTMGRWSNPFVCAIRDNTIRVFRPMIARQEEKLQSYRA